LTLFPCPAAFPRSSDNNGGAEHNIRSSSAVRRLLVKSEYKLPIARISKLPLSQKEILRREFLEN